MKPRSTTLPARPSFPPRPGRRARLLAVPALLGLALGCGTTRITDTKRSATEQLLISNAIDRSVSQLDFQALAGKPVFLDDQHLDKDSVDRGYLVSTLRQHLLASGCLLQEERAKATYVVEARSGGVGTDHSSLLVGVPQMNVPALAPGQPTSIPEIPLAKKSDQTGVAKVAVFAYNRKTGRPVFQSGVVQAMSTSADLWVLGAGPFQNGTIRDKVTFAGQPLALPGFGGEGGADRHPAVAPVTDAAAWSEPPRAEDSPAAVRVGSAKGAGADDVAAAKPAPTGAVPVAWAKGAGPAEVSASRPKAPAVLPRHAGKDLFSSAAGPAPEGR
jgi:hypothetical protein